MKNKILTLITETDRVITGYPKSIFYRHGDTFEFVLTDDCYYGHKCDVVTIRWRFIVMVK